MVFSAPSVALASFGHIDINDPEIFYGLGDSMTLEDALSTLNRQCKKQKYEAQLEKNRRIKKINRSLGKLEGFGPSKRKSLDKEDSRHKRNIKKIEKTCQRARKKIIKRYKKVNVPSGIQTTVDPDIPTKGLSLFVAKKKQEYFCVQQKKEAWKEYHRQRRKKTRSIGSLGKSRRGRQHDEDGSRKKLLRRLDEIDAVCEKQMSKFSRLSRKAKSAYERSLKRKRAIAEARPPYEGPLFHDFRLKGKVRLEGAHRIERPHDYTKLRSNVFLEQSFSFVDKLNFQFSQRAFYDAVFDVEDNFPKTVEDDLESEIELRDAYVDYSIGPFDWRVGKQQIVWGESIGFFVADEVNAKDFREFVLQDFDLIRIPQWAADLAFFIGPLHLEGVVLLPEMNELGETGSEFFISLPLPAGTPFTLIEATSPVRTGRNLESGGRLSYLIAGWDLGAFYLHTWEKNPIFFRQINGGVFNFRPAFRRQDIYGATFTKDIWNFILKGEFVAKPDSYFSTFDLTDRDGVTRHDTWQYVVGLDKTLFEKFETMVQFSQRQISDFSPLLVREKAKRNLITVRTSFDLFSERFRPEYLVVSDLEEKDRMHRPSLRIRVSDNMNIKVGADLFEGRSPRGIFSLFEKKDRGYAEAEYYF